MASAEPGSAPVAADALVFFGATGDLAYKKIFPSLQGMIQRGGLKVPVIGVAKSGWASSSCGNGPARASRNTAAAWTRRRSASSWRSSSTSTATTETRRPFRGCARCLGPQSTRLTTSRSRPAFSARSSSSSESPAARMVRGSSSRSPSATTSRRRGRSTRRSTRRSRRIVGLPHRPLSRQGGGREPPVLPLREYVPRAHLESQLRRLRADHDGRGVRRPGTGQVLRRDGRNPRRHPEPPPPSRRRISRWSPRSPSMRTASATSRSRCFARFGR